MQNIIPVSHLKSYSKVVKRVMKNRPVFLTHNGVPTYVLLNLEEYEELLRYKECLFEVVGQLLEANGLLEEEEIESADTEKTNKTTDEFYELNCGIINENIDIATSQNSEDTRQAETEEIWETLLDVLKGMSVICDLIEKMFFDIYGVKINSFKDHHKESKWK